MFYDTVQKGSLQGRMLKQSPAVQYYLRSCSEETDKNPNITIPTPASGRKS